MMQASTTADDCGELAERPSIGALRWPLDESRKTLRDRDTACLPARVGKRGPEGQKHRWDLTSELTLEEGYWVFGQWNWDAPRKTATRGTDIRIPSRRRAQGSGEFP
ncbi:hypothetical protein JX265_003449 [Neoarthrinium moseri]|uniref:Uncharacterized protein n=1 Tax=Neoarthrinium moseri TaxID=1658444 RepID=A0A9P9WS77_9PEZI|nr:hypothetical protein JX266_004455 [Neoarthrinium moseri]KAI1877441.1 hypothetical protein JX265_003449 [Neoarthrinium moseri]